MPNDACFEEKRLAPISNVRPRLIAVGVARSNISRDTVDRLDEARDLRAAARTDLKCGGYVDPHAGRVRFDAWAREWFESRHKLGDAKRSKGRALLEKHVIGDVTTTAWVRCNSGASVRSRFNRG